MGHEQVETLRFFPTPVENGLPILMNQQSLSKIYPCSLQRHRCYFDEVLNRSYIDETLNRCHIDEALNQCYIDEALIKH